MSEDFDHFHKGMLDQEYKTASSWLFPDCACCWITRAVFVLLVISALFLLAGCAERIENVQDDADWLWLYTHGYTN